MSVINDILDFLMPRRCVLCKHLISGNGTMLCPSCALNLPLAPPCDYTDNDLARVFWHRLPIERGIYMMRYKHEDQSAQLILAPKFNRRDDISICVGHLLAANIPVNFFDGIDIIIPMPSIKKRLKERGMNHVEEAAKAMVEAMKLPIKILPDAVVRSGYKKSQIGLSPEERVNNISPDDFRVTRPELLQNRHILIMDDVVTTGSSVYAIARAILDAVPSVRFSVLAISRPSD